MNRQKLLAAMLTIVIVLSQIMIPGVTLAQVSGTDAVFPLPGSYTGWTKLGSNPVLGRGLLSGSPSVIYDSASGTYKMWYTHGVVNAAKADGLINNIRGLNLGTLIADLSSGNFRAVANNDAAGIKAAIDYLATLTSDNLTDLLAGSTGTISYATSIDGRTWQHQADVLATSPGAWDKIVLGTPSVIKTGSGYEMWYTGSTIDMVKAKTLLTDLSLLSATNISSILSNLIDANISGTIAAIRAARGDQYLFDVIIHTLDLVSSTNMAVGHATSTDGLTWAKDPANPVLQKGVDPAFDRHGVGTPSVIKNGDTYEMWFTGIKLDYNQLLLLLLAQTLGDIENALLAGVNVSIGHATSTNGSTWAKDANPVLQKGALGTWDSYGVFAPSVVKNPGGNYEIWYTGAKAVPATFRDFLRQLVTFNSAIATGTNLAIGHATSASGVTWTKDTGNPVVSKGSSGAWDEWGAGFPSVVRVGSSTLMWYTGIKTNPKTAILSLLAGNGVDTAFAGSQIAIGHAHTATDLSTISVTPAGASLVAGRTQQYTATGTYTDGSTVDVTTSVTWSSSDTTRASIDNLGLATGRAAGGLTIVATKGSVSGSTSLTVTAATLDTITVSPANTTITVGATRQFRAVGTYTDGTKLDVTTTAAWSSNNTAAASINAATGLATGAGAGVAQIKASLSSKEGTTNLTVTTAALASIAITPSSPSVAAGKTVQLTATGTYSDSNTADITSVATWNSSANATARVNAAGVATGYVTGTANVTASMSGITSPARTLTVTDAVYELLSVTPETPSLFFVSGNPPALQFRATSINSDGSTTDVTTTSGWTSSNLLVATIGGGTGLVTTVGAGTTTITANKSGKSDSTVLTVMADAIAPAVTVSSPAEGSTVQVQALTVSGRVDDRFANASVIVNGGAPQAAPLDVNGNFSKAVNLLVGKNTILVRATDAANNTGTSGTITVTVNANQPAIAITAPLEMALTSNPTVNVTGTIAGASAATMIVNGFSIAVVPAAGAFAASAPLREGENIIVVNAYLDGHSGDANYLGTSGARRVVRDTTPPVVTIESPVTGSVVSRAEATVSGGVNDPAVNSATLTVNGTPSVIPVVAGRFSQTMTLATGANTISVVAADPAGNVSAASPVSVTLDTSIPAVTLTAPANKLLTNIAAQTVTGNVADPSITTASLYLNGILQTIAVAPDGSFSKMVTLSSGPNTIEVRASDSAGNTGTSGVATVTLDNTAPILTIGLSDPTTSITATVAANEDLAAAPVVTINPTPVTAVMAPVDVNKWSGVYGSEAAPLANGNYTVSISGTDRAGNVATKTASFTKTQINVDGVLPTTVSDANTTLQVQTNGAVNNAGISFTQHLSNPSGNVGTPTSATRSAGVFLEINADPALQQNLRDIYIRASYSVADLPAGTDEATLKLYLWDLTSGTWSVVPGSGVNTTDRFVYGTVTHLSKFGGFGSAATTTVVNTPTLVPTPGVTTLSGFLTAQGVFTTSVTAQTNDGRAYIAFAPGVTALKTDGSRLDTITMLKVSETAPATLPTNASLAGYLYDFSPAGAAFSPAVPLTIAYDPALLPAGADQSKLSIAYYDSATARWASLSSVVNKDARTVTAPVSHFTNFAVLLFSRPANFTVSSLTITPTSPKIADVVTISAMISNTGDLSGTISVSLKINNIVAKTQSVTLASGTSQKVTFTAVVDSAGSYSVDVNGQTGRFTVAAPVTPPPPPPPPPPAPAPATFSISGLQVTPAQISIGGSVGIAVTVNNTGGVPGSYDVILKINGAQVSTQRVTLAAGETRRITFSLPATVAGTASVDVNGLTGTFAVSRGAAFSVSNPSASPSEVLSGQPVTITAQVANTGDTAGGYTVTLKVNDTVVETRNVTVSAGATQAVSFTVTRTGVGAYSVDINGQKTTFVVNEPAPPPITPWIIGAIILVVLAAAAGVIFLILRRRMV